MFIFSSILIASFMSLFNMDDYFIELFEYIENKTGKCFIRPTIGGYYTFYIACGFIGALLGVLLPEFI